MTMNTLRRGTHPFWLIAAASLWMAVAGNLALWRTLADLHVLQGPAGWRFGAAFVVAIAAVLTALIGPLAWRRTLKPTIAVLLVVTALGAHFMSGNGVVIDPSMMVNVVQTHPRESADLMGRAFWLSLLGLGAVPAALLWLWPVRQAPWRRQVLRNAGWSLVALAVAVLAVLAAFPAFAATMREHKSLLYLINPMNSIYALGSVAAAPLRPAAREFRRIGEDAHLVADPTRPTLLVLVVGETARSDHFGLNGYARDTTPALTREPGLVSLRRVTSCGTSTAASLPCMFSHLGRDGFADRDANHENLLDVLQRAGLAVLWLDNQAGCKGVCDRALCHDGECLDGVMLQGLDQRLAALPAEARRRGVVLVMHQMGSHGPAYHRRSPPELKRFGPECENASLQDCAREQVVNAYDHSILATDRFLASTIGWLKAQSARYDTAMLYVSDHGESLGEGQIYLAPRPCRDRGPRRPGLPGLAARGRTEPRPPVPHRPRTDGRADPGLPACARRLRRLPRGRASSVRQRRAAEGAFGFGLGESAASAARSRRVSTRSTRCLIDATRAGCIEKHRKPIASSRSVKAASPAISPQTLTSLPAACAAAIVPWISRSTAGCQGSNRCETSSSARSIASVYWIRSLVPIDTKSRCGRNCSIINAAAGTSTIAPIRTGP